MYSRAEQRTGEKETSGHHTGGQDCMFTGSGIQSFLQQCDHAPLEHKIQSLEQVLFLGREVETMQEEAGGTRLACSLFKGEVTILLQLWTCSRPPDHKDSLDLKNSRPNYSLLAAFDGLCRIIYLVTLRWQHTDIRPSNGLCRILLQ
ncbi:uncharacterized protein LOC119719780 [Patiria miniata]|uniref:Uncharacterized protein n=1 Tax=Patiria miniata TaxID=46514 RepID=A0A913Z0K8_PATMI|nr:uncharacterized protein LOC119719780 [Patiria miniata]